MSQHTILAADLYIGRRLSFDGSRCTIRYVGALKGVKGQWLGVEWDDDTRGKHNGSHSGDQLFVCLSRSPTAGSFVKSSRKPDPERHVLQAVKHKYGHDSEDASATTDTVVISGKVAEEVGFEKILQEQSQLSELRIVLLDDFLVHGISARNSDVAMVKAAQDELQKTCPNIRELDIGYNLIESWQGVVDVCTATPYLQILRASGLRLSAFESLVPTNTFARLKELYLEYCLVATQQVVQVLQCPPLCQRLEQLHLSGNQLETLFEPIPTPPLLMPNLRSLILDNNLFSDLGMIAPVIAIAPNLKHLSLQANRIDQVGPASKKQISTFSKLNSLNLADNLIDSYSFLDKVANIIPSLESLRISGNAVYQQQAIHDTRASDKSFYLTLARLPLLKMLNHGPIIARDRQEGELYYLSVAENDFKRDMSSAHNHDALVVELRQSFPRYDTLCEKYSRVPVYSQDSNANAPDRPQKKHMPELQYPAGSLGARLVKATFYLKAAADSKVYSPAKVIAELPNSITVMQMTSYLLRQPEFGDRVRPMRFRLVHETKELDPVDSTAESSTRSTTYGRNLSAEEKAAIWKEWGEWDADDPSRSAAEDTTYGGAHDSKQLTTDGEFYVKDGRRWKRREVDIPLSLKRPWGDWLDDAKEVTIRIEAFT